MDAAIVNGLSLALSLIALTISVFVAARQIRIMAHANQIPVLMGRTEFRSKKFLAAEFYVLNRLNAEHDASLATGALPDDARIQVERIASLFTSVGALLVHRMVLDEAVVVAQFGYRADRAWRALEGRILRERTRRQDDLYAAPWEYLVGSYRRNHLSAYRRRLRRRAVTRHDQ